MFKRGRSRSNKGSTKNSCKEARNNLLTPGHSFLKKLSASVFALTTLVLLLGLTGCGPSPRNWNHPAPQSEQETGVIVNFTDSQLGLSQQIREIKKLEARGAQIREINTQHGIFEIFGLTEATVAHLISDAYISKNSFYPNFSPKTLFSSFAESFQAKANKKIVYCELVEGLPTIEIEIKSKNYQITNNTDNPSMTFKRDSQPVAYTVSFPEKSFPHTWIIAGPRTSQYGFVTSADATFKITPDELGIYQSLLLLELTPEISCAFQHLFAVTDDVPYKGKSASIRPSTTKLLNDFAHLKKLNMDRIWRKSMGKDVLVAVIDSGLDYNHPDLANNIHVNTKEIPNNGKDDDGNGLVDDYVGYDFMNMDPYAYDDMAHGTHVAGIIGSLVGLAPQAKILPIKVLSPFGSDTATLISGIYYAVDQGAQVINISAGGGTAGHRELFRAIEYAKAHNVTIVAASGNNGTNIDINPLIPASLPNSNLITVGSIKLQDDNLAPYSNWGPKSVDIVTYGGWIPKDPNTDKSGDGGIISTYFENRLNEKYAPMAGTSMAAPVVTGAVALILANHPDASPDDIKNLLLRSGREDSRYLGKVLSARSLDISAALGLGPRK